MQFDQQVQSLTQDFIVPKVTDQVLQSNVFTMILMAHGSPWYGETLKFPVKMRKNTQGGSFDDYSEFKIKNENVREIAQFDPRAYYQSVVIGGISRSVNEISKTQVLSLVKTEMEAVQQSMIDDIGTLTYADGTGNDGKDFLGTGAAVDDGGDVSVYGGLSRATFDPWQSTLQTTVGAFDFSKARTLHNSATRGNQKPTIDVCDEEVFGFIESDYQASVEGNYNVMSGDRAVLTMAGVKPQTRAGLTGHAGFDILYYAGTPIVKDDKSSAQELGAYNTDFLRWYGVKAAEATPVDIKSLYHEANDYDRVPSSLGFSWTGFVRPADQYAWIGQFLVIGNQVTPAPNLHSRSLGITS